MPGAAYEGQPFSPSSVCSSVMNRPSVVMPQSNRQSICTNSTMAQSVAAPPTHPVVKLVVHRLAHRRPEEVM